MPQVARPPDEAFLRRLDDFERRLRALEAALRKLTGTTAAATGKESPSEEPGGD